MFNCLVATISVNCHFIICLWSCHTQEQIRQGCAWMRERERKSVHVITDIFNCCISLKLTSKSSRGSMDTSCYLCPNEVKGPEAVCTDCLNLLPSPSKIKTEIQEYSSETPQVSWGWEWEFLHDHLPTTSEAEKDEGGSQVEEEMNVANDEDLDDLDHDQIFWSDTSSDSGYQSPEELSLSQPYYNLPALRTDEAMNLSTEDLHPRTTDEDLNLSQQDSTGEDSQPSHRLSTKNEEIFKFLWTETEDIADKLISNGVFPGISFHSG